MESSSADHGACGFERKSQTMSNSSWLCCGNASNSCQDISVRTKVMNRPTDAAVPGAVAASTAEETVRSILVHLRRDLQLSKLIRPAPLAISKTFTQHLLQLNGSRSFIPKHKAKRGIDQKEIKSEQRGMEQRAGRDGQHRDRAEWLGNFWSL